MKRSRIVIAMLSLVVVFALAGCGAASEPNDNQGEQAPQGQPAEQGQDATNVAFDEAKAKDTYQASCAGCHGANLEGGFGDALADVGSRLSADEMYDIIKKGRGQMPPQGQVSDEDARNVAEWLASLK